MSIAKGYKQTEVGVIPEDWEVYPLEELATKIGSGITPTGGSTVYKNYGRPFIRSQNIGWGNLLLEDIAFIDDEIHQTFPNTEIKLNDVFLNISGASIGRSSFANKILVGGNVNQHVCIIRVIDKKLVPIYLNLFLLSKNGQKQIDSFQSGGNRQGLNIGQIKTFKVPVPPTIEEQTAIANALSDMDALIAQTEKLIEKKKAIKQGVMQELLKPKEGWVTKKLGENTSILRGGSPRPIEDFLTTTSDGINWIKIGDVGKTAKYITSTDEKITPAGMSRSRIVKPGDFLLSNSMSFGRPYIMQISGCIHDGWLVITEYESNFDRDFLYYVLGSEAIFTQYKSMASGSSVLNLSKEIVKEVKVICPKYLDEQKQIARILSDIDIDIDFTETKLQKLKNQKQGMMQALLTGKIRLV